MKGVNMLTVEKVKELAIKNYTKGGDTIVECFTDKEIQDLINNGINTQKKLMEFFKQHHEYDEEQRKAALWHGYGTTDEVVIAESFLTTTKTETEPEEYDTYADDPCYMCPRMDSGYNCKHCEYGDDGNYSIYDLYSPSELL
jgi:hypothetical protein